MYPNREPRRSLRDMLTGFFRRGRGQIMPVPAPAPAPAPAPIPIPVPAPAPILESYNQHVIRMQEMGLIPLSPQQHIQQQLQLGREQRQNARGPRLPPRLPSNRPRQQQGIPWANPANYAIIINPNPDYDYPFFLGTRLR